MMGGDSDLHIMRIALAFHKLPHEVRAMDVGDFVTTLAFLEIVDEEAERQCSTC